MEQDLMSTECVRALVFICQLETAGPKLLCAPMHCLGAKTNHNSTIIIFFRTVSFNFVAAWTKNCWFTV